MDKSQFLKPREYEMLAILLPDQGEDETAAAIETMLAHITNQDGTIDKTGADSPWGRRRLAYTIRHAGVDYRDGHYVLVHFTALPTAISEIERELKLDTNVIRYLILIHDPEMGEKFDESQIAEGEEAETEAATSEQAPVAEAETTEEAATEDAPAETEEASAEDAPAEATEEVATEDAPAETEEASAEDAPAETTEEVATEEAPAEEPAAKEAADVEQAEESDKE